MRIMLFFLVLSFQAVLGQSIIGKWKTTDDVTGKEKGIVEIFERNGKYYGRIIEIFDAGKRHQKCDKCLGDEKDKPILGLIILKDLQKNGDAYDSGTITDPKNGKSYRCKITLEGRERLIVRGYLGVTLLGRSQIWTKVK